jgi:hypothetical protein
MNNISNGLRERIKIGLVIGFAIAMYALTAEGSDFTPENARRLAEPFESIERLKNYKMAYSDAQRDSFKKLADYPVEGLLADIIRLPQDSRDYRLTREALSLNRNLLSLDKIRKTYAKLAGQREKKKDLTQVFRSIQFNAISLKNGTGTIVNITRRTWDGRTAASLAIITAEIEGFKRNHPGEVYTIGDFAVSDGTSSLELARRFKDNKVRVIGSDKILNLWAIHLTYDGMKVIAIFNPDIRLVQLIDEATRRLIHLGMLDQEARNNLKSFIDQKLGSGEIDLIPDSERISLINPEAEEFIASNPGKLEFRSYDVFKPVGQKFNFIRVAGLLMRGKHSYFKDEDIKSAISNLGRSLFEGGVILNGEFSEKSAKYDVFRKIGNELRLDLAASTGYKSYSEWERIDISSD